MGQDDDQPELGHALGCHDVPLCGLARRGERDRGRHRRTIQERRSLTISSVSWTPPRS